MRKGTLALGWVPVLTAFALVLPAKASETFPTLISTAAVTPSETHSPLPPPDETPPSPGLYLSGCEFSSGNPENNPALPAPSSAWQEGAATQQVDIFLPNRLLPLSLRLMITFRYNGTHLDSLCDTIASIDNETPDNTWHAVQASGRSAFFPWKQNPAGAFEIYAEGRFSNEPTSPSEERILWARIRVFSDGTHEGSHGETSESDFD